MIRRVLAAVRVPGAPPPYDTLHARVYYPAAEPTTAAERLSGVLPADQRHAPLPVVIFCSGINVGCEGYGWLAAQLAAAGYAVVLYDYVAETLPGAVGLTPGLDLERVRPDIYGTGPTCPALPPLFDLLADLNDRPGPLHQVLDLTTAALGGHSAGGTVALHNGGYFPGVAAVFAYAGHTMASTLLGFPPETVLPIADKPTLLMRGDRDGVIAASRGRYGPADADHDPVARTFAEALPTTARGPLYDALIAGANHFAVVYPWDESAGRAFLDGEPGRPAEAIRATIAGLLLAFLARHLRGAPVAVSADHTFIRSR
jgi:dienelactone hydrolase